MSSRVGLPPDHPMPHPPGPPSKDGGPFSFQETIVAIPDPVRTNFNTLLCAAGDGNLALTECLDAVTP